MLTGEASRADDLVQDTLARGWEKRRLWRSGSDLRAWLFTIMHNVHVNQLALARRDAANVSIDADPGNPAWQLPVRANQLDRVELLELVQQMGRLSADQREVLLLAAVEELRYEEIAEHPVDTHRHGDVAAVARAQQSAAADRRAGVGAARRQVSRRADA